MVEPGKQKMKTMVTERTGRRGLRSAVFTILILVALLLAFGFFAVRTDYGQQSIERALTKRLGIPITIGSARIVWPYDLVLSGVSTETETETGDPGFKADELRINWSWPRQMHIELRGPVAILQQTETGDWVPSVFAALGPLQDIAGISAVTDTFERDWSVDVTDGAIRWNDIHQTELASVGGIRFSMTPVQLPSRVLTHYYLYVRHAYGSGGYRLSGLEREWMATEDNTYIEIMSRENQAAPSGGGGFWTRQDQPAPVEEVSK